MRLKPRLRYIARILPATRLYFKYRDRSLVRYPQFAENLMIASSVTNRINTKDGAIVECGTWKGGMAGALIGICGLQKRYVFFDSFDGMPAPSELDGERAIEWLADNAIDNARSSVAIFQETIARSGINSANVQVVEGLFENTLPGFQSPEILVLRLDADWYDSTMVCLTKFWDHIVPGGVVLIDDYYSWDGCTRAVHDFLSDRELTERVQQGPIGRVAFIVKGQTELL